MNIKPEVLAPAGDFERLVTAIKYGADAVYLAGKEFGMRAASTNFDNETLKKAVEYAHARGVKVYLTCNTLPRNEEVERFPEYVKFVEEIGVDACIANDIGVLSLIKKYAPNLEIHISTQAGIVNYQTANAFYEMGARRVVLARELSLEEIKEIRAKVPEDLEIEAFVHGAMCMSFSGRCLISNYILNRDANRGECAQPCRWGYHLVEEKRPGEYFPVFEDEKGTYILNAKDMCMIEYIDKLAEAGITSFKIEGRMKSTYYVAVVTNAYRMAVDEYLKDRENFKLSDWIKDEVYKVSHRRYSTGFYFDEPEQYYENGGYLREYDVVAETLGYEDGYIDCIQKNKFLIGDEIEILMPLQKPIVMKVEKLLDENGNEIEDTRHANMRFKLKCDTPVCEGAFIRKQRPEGASRA